jgi:integrase
MAKATRVKTRHDGIYQVGDRFEWKYGKQHRGTVDTIDEALDARAKARLAGPSPAAVRGAFDEYARTWLAGYQGRTSRGFTEGSREGYRESLDLYAIPFFEGRRLKPGQIQRRHVKAFIAWLAAEPTAAERAAKTGLHRPLAPRTIVKHLAPLKAMFADAVEDDDLPINPGNVRVNVTARALEHDDDGEARALTDEQLAAVLAAPLERDQLLIDTVAATGARFGEFCEWQGKDLATGPSGPVLRVRRSFSDKARDADGKRVGLVKLPKSDNGRRDIPLDPELARRLWRLQRRPDELLFTAPRGGRLHYQNSRRDILGPTLERAAAAAGEDLAWVTWHTFRHTLASRLFAAGRNPKQVQRWLGHHKASFTLDTYIHLMADDIGTPLPLPAAAGGTPGAHLHPETSGTDEGAADAKPLQTADTPDTQGNAVAES